MGNTLLNWDGDEIYNLFKMYAYSVYSYFMFDLTDETLDYLSFEKRIVCK